MKLSSYKLKKLLKFQEMELFRPKLAKPEKPEILIFLKKSYLHILE